MRIDLPSNIVEDIRDMLQGLADLLDNIEVRKLSGLGIEDTVRLWIHSGGYARFLTQCITEFNEAEVSRLTSGAIKSV